MLALQREAGNRAVTALVQQTASAQHTVPIQRELAFQWGWTEIWRFDGAVPQAVEDFETLRNTLGDAETAYEKASHLPSGFRDVLRSHLDEVQNFINMRDNTKVPLDQRDEVIGKIADLRRLLAIVSENQRELERTQLEKEWQESTKRSEEAAEAEARKKPGQKLDAEVKKARQSAFRKKRRHAAEELAGAIDTARRIETRTSSALHKVREVPDKYRTYDLDAKRSLAAATSVLDTSIGPLRSHIGRLVDNAEGFENKTGEDYRVAVADVRKGGKVVDRCTSALQGFDAMLNRFSVSAVRNRMQKIIDDEYTSDTRLGPSWADFEKRRAQSLPSNQITSLLEFRQHLDTVVHEQHNPKKSEWLLWMQQGLEWEKWKHGLWGADDVGTVDNYKVHATRYLNDVEACSVDEPLDDMYNNLLGTGVSGFHVTMEVDGPISRNNPHAYRGGPAHDNGYGRWQQAEPELQALLQNTVRRAESRIKALKERHGQRGKRARG